MPNYSPSLAPSHPLSLIICCYWVVGLPSPYSVGPFPLFEWQAAWIHAVYSGQRPLPPIEEQLQWLQSSESGNTTT